MQFKNALLPGFVLPWAAITVGQLAVPAAHSASPEPVVAGTLSGSSVVPGPGDTDGRGTITLNLKPETKEICYELTVTGITDATEAHIYKGAAGSKGSKVEKLTDKVDDGTGCVKTDSTKVAEIAANPAGYYVQINSKEFKDGAIRGQLQTSSTMGPQRGAPAGRDTAARGFPRDTSSSRGLPQDSTSSRGFPRDTSSRAFPPRDTTSNRGYPSDTGRASPMPAPTPRPE